MKPGPKSKILESFRNCKNHQCVNVNPQPIENFHKRGANSTNRRHICKDCWTIRCKPAQHKFYKNNSKLCSYRTMRSAKKNIHRRRQNGRKFRSNNLLKVQEQDRIRYAKNPEIKKISSKKYAKANPGKVTAYSRNRDLAQLQRTPKWLTTDDHKFMELFYKEAERLTATTNIPHEVDHIIPIKGKNVSGLHVPWNLQILTRVENRNKSNRF